MPQADEFSGAAAIAVADRNPSMAPDAVERVAAAARAANPGGTPQQHVAWTSSAPSDPDGRG